MRRNIALIIAIVFVATVSSCTQRLVVKHKLLTSAVNQYEKAEFAIDVAVPIVNPHDQREIAVNMIITSPTGKKLALPCYYESAQSGIAVWRARFTPQDSGEYTYHFQVKKRDRIEEETDRQHFVSKATASDGFLHTHDDYWTFIFDSGKPFRGIGENIGWENRSFEDPKWTYDYLLPTLSQNGANFFRTWMCVWNLPLAWNKVNDTDRYSNSTEYFNPDGIKRMDELVEMSDSLGLYFMLSIDAHGALMPDGYWKYNSHNVVNGGTAHTPAEFFTDEESRWRYKNRLRYMIARWGYSPSIAAWEFFNEIDNAVFTPTPHDSVLIDHKIITAWHDEMSTYLKDNDPYGHIVTTSISHRDIEGMNALKNIDLNQKHIYNKTHLLAPTIERYVELYKKPYVIGEFGYDWNWDNVKHEYGEGFDYDYKRGLWYGLFSPTPILPMTWWWEFFDERKMTPYFKSVRDIHDQMMTAGKGSFAKLTVQAPGLEAYGVTCGDHQFVYLLNNTKKKVISNLRLPNGQGRGVQIRRFDPVSKVYSTDADIRAGAEITLPLETFDAHQEMVLIISPAGASIQTVDGQ